MDKIDELIKTLIRRTTDYGSVPCEEDAQMAMLDIEATRAALRAEFERMEKENAALKEAQRWIPVADELPEKSQNYLVCAVYPVGVKPFVDLCYYVRKFGFADFGAKITHWMPLPQPPEPQC